MHLHVDLIKKKVFKGIKAEWNLSWDHNKSLKRRKRKIPETSADKTAEMRIQHEALVFL